MIGARIAACIVLWACAAFALSPDYFPLHPGNQWVYRCTGNCGEPLLVAGIVKSGFIGGKWYSLYEGFGGSRTWLRQDGDGMLWALDETTGSDKRWYAFATPEGQGYQTSVQPCSTQARMSSRNYRYDGPAGGFPETLWITYTGPCSDAGLTEEVFYRWTGLMRRTETTFAGPRTWDLIYSRTAGVTVISQPEMHFSVTLDKAVYTANLMPPVDPATSIPRLTARLTLRNTTGKPVALDFPTGQRYDLEIKDERGSVVYRWSDGRAFTMVFGREDFGPGEKSYVTAARLADVAGRPLPQGRYTATGWLTTSGQRSYSASVGFEIRYVY